MPLKPTVITGDEFRPESRSMASFNLDPGSFKSLDANPGGTLELFTKYVEKMQLVFELAFRKVDGTPYEPSDKKRKQCFFFVGAMI